MTKPLAIIISDHPIESVNEQIVFYGLEEGIGVPISELVGLSPFEESYIYVNDDVVYEEDWESTEVSGTDTVVITPNPGILGIIGTFVSYVVANWPAMVAALTMSYLGGMLFNAQLPEFERSTDREQKQSYGWNPRTIRTEGVPKPFSIGTNAHYGNIVSQWTDVETPGGNETLFIKQALGEGPTTGIVTSTVWLNGQPIGNFSGATLTSTPGTISQAVMTGFEQDKLELSVQKEVTNSGGAYEAHLPRTGFDDVEWTLEFRGLYHYNEMGDQLNNSVSVKVEISDVAVVSWTTLLNENITASERGSYYVAYTASDTSGFSADRTKQYKLRITKQTADRNSARYGDHLYLRSVRGVVDTAFTHPGMVLVGIKALATELLNNDLNIKVLHSDKILRYYDGADWQIDANRNRAWGVYNILTQPVITGTGESGDPWVIDSYEGFQPSQIDTAFFFTWAAFCDTQVADGDGGIEDAYPLDQIYDKVRELWATAVETASIGRAHLYWQGTTLTGWLDNTVANAGDLICYQNIVEGTWRQEWAKQSDLAGTVVVTLQDASRGYKNIPWPSHNVDGGTYTRTIDIDGIGVKTRAFGSRVGTFILERNKRIRELIQFTMFKDALLYSVGGIYPVQHRRPNWGASYQVTVAAAATAVTITLDRTITNNATDDIYIRSFNVGSGEIETNQYTVDSINDTQVTIFDSGGLTLAVAHGDIVAIGTSTEIKQRRLIGKHALPNHMFDMVMETYDADLFDVDSLTPTTPYPNYTPAATENKLIQPATQWDIRNTVDQILPPAISTDIPWIGNISWEVESGGDIVWLATNGDEPLLFRLKGTPHNITADSYTPGSGENEIFFYWDPNFTTIFRPTLVGGTAVANPNWMVATYKDGVIYPATPIQLLHAAIILAGSIRADQYFELRQTMPWAWEDSIDASKPFTVDFHLPSELTAIVSLKLSFKIKPYRAYSTTDVSGGGSSPTSAGGGTGFLEATEDTGLTSNSTKADISTNSKTANASPDDPHQHDLTAGTAYFDGHTHTTDAHDHLINLDDHTHEVTVPNHQHGLTYGIHEENNAPITVHYHIDNGAGFGGASSNYTSDQTDLDISGSVSGSGWKAVRFDVDKRSRLVITVDAKVDITA